MFSDGHKLVRLKLYEYTIFGLKDFMRKKNLKTDTKNKGDLKRGHNYSRNRRHTKIACCKEFVYIEGGWLGGTHSTCFFV